MSIQVESPEAGPSHPLGKMQTIRLPSQFTSETNQDASSATMVIPKMNMMHHSVALPFLFSLIRIILKESSELYKIGSQTEGSSGKHITTRRTILVHHAFLYHPLNNAPTFIEVMAN